MLVKATHLLSRLTRSKNPPNEQETDERSRRVERYKTLVKQSGCVFPDKFDVGYETGSSGSPEERAGRDAKQIDEEIERNKE